MPNFWNTPKMLLRGVSEMLNIIVWISMFIAILFLFEIPQKVYYAVKKRDNKIQEVKVDERGYNNFRDDDERDEF